MPNVIFHPGLSPGTPQYISPGVVHVGHPNSPCQQAGGSGDPQDEPEMVDGVESDQRSEDREDDLSKPAESLHGDLLDLADDVSTRTSSLRSTVPSST